jgi:hypothetical protein
MYSEENSGHWSAGGIQDETKHSLLLQGLQPNTAYQFKVRARTEAGLGPSSPIVQYTTPAGDVWLWIFILLEIHSLIRYLSLKWN